MIVLRVVRDPPLNSAQSWASPEEEADEVAYWLELLSETKLVPDHRLGDLRRETDEILAMIVSSIKTARTRTRSKTR